MSKGKALVHEYFGAMGWSPEKADPNQYLNVNFRADWLGEKIDDHVSARIHAASESARQELELLRERVKLLAEEVDRVRLQAAYIAAQRDELRAELDKIEEMGNPFHVKAPT